MTIKAPSATGFDRLAASYDRLAQMVFGAAICESQRVWLGQIPPGSRILWVGGGTGELLPALLAQVQPAQVTYLELSPRMLARARARLAPAQQARVDWRVGTEADLPPEARYDALLTFFVLDLFDPPHLAVMLDRLHRHLRPGGRWLFTDFVPQAAWHRLLLRLMYLTFRVLCGISGRHELPFAAAFAQRGYQLGGERRFFRGMIAARWYKRG